MSTIVFSTYGSRGDVLPYLAIARELRRRGHRAIITTSSDFRGTVESAGVEFAFVPPEAPDASQRKAAMDPATGDEFLLRRLLLPCLRESVAMLGAIAADADVLVTHVASIAGPIVAAQGTGRGLKWVSGVIAPMTLLSFQDPPTLPVAPWAARYPSFNRGLLRLLRRQFGMWLKPVQRLRNELGLPSGENAVWNDAHSPTRALGLFSPRYASRASDWPASLQVMGWCFEARSEVLPPEIERFLKGGDAPLLFVAASFNESGVETWIRESLDGAKRLSRRAILLGVPQERVRSSDEALVLRYAPLEAILPHCALISHQGGIGTLALALREGTPMLICPGAHDQFDTARRAMKLEIAHILARRDYRGQLLAEALDGVLKNAAMKERLGEWQRDLERENGTQNAADEIEKVLGS